MKLSSAAANEKVKDSEKREEKSKLKINSL